MFFFNEQQRQAVAAMKRSVALARRYMEVQTEAFEELHPSGKLHPLVALSLGASGPMVLRFLETGKFSFLPRIDLIIGLLEVNISSL